MGVPTGSFDSLLLFVFVACKLLVPQFDVWEYEFDESTSRRESVGLLFGLNGVTGFELMRIVSRTTAGDKK